jgi:hypothetical protein
MMIRTCIRLQAAFLSSTLDCIKTSYGFERNVPLFFVFCFALIADPSTHPTTTISAVPRLQLFGVGKNIRRADRRILDLSPTRRQIRCFDLEFLGGISAHMQTCNGG